MNFRVIAATTVLLFGVSTVGAATLTNFAEINDVSKVEPPIFWVQGSEALDTSKASSVSQTLSSASNTTLSYSVSNDLSFDYSINANVTLERTGSETTDMSTSVNGVTVTIGDSQPCNQVFSSTEVYNCTATFTSTPQTVNSGGTIDVEVNMSSDANINENSRLDFRVN
jgi:hypothetical protein